MCILQACDAFLGKAVVNGKMAERPATQSKILVNDFIAHWLQSCGMDWDNCNQPNGPTLHKCCVVMRQVAEDFLKLQKQDQTFVLAEQLSLYQGIPADLALERFNGVLSELFSTGIKWGYIVALVAFTGHMAEYAKKNGMPELAEKFADASVIYLDRPDIQNWLNENGGWDGFVSFYANRGVQEDFVWPKSFSTFLTSAAAVGAIGAATLAFYLRT